MMTQELAHAPEAATLNPRLLLRRLARESAYLLGAFPLAVCSFVVAVTVLSVGVATAIIWIGVPILAFGLVAIGGFAAVERRLANAATGQPMPPAKYLPATGGGIAGTLAPLRDPQRWFDALWVLVNFVLSTLTFCVALTWWAAALWLPFGPFVNAILRRAGLDDPGLFGMTGFHWDLVEYAFALVCVLTLPWVVHAMAKLRATTSYILLSTRPGLEERIDTLRESREAAHGAETASLHKLERDIHDGPQQRLVRLQLDLARAERMAATDPERSRVLLAEARRQTADTLAELRDLSRGIAPAVLQDRGLAAALEDLAGRSDLVCVVDCDVRPLPPHVAGALYFTAAEAVTNANKHSCATHVDVTVTQTPVDVTLVVQDNGIGGASAAKGHGLAGLERRLRGVEGTLTVDSPVGGPTVVQAVVPCAS